MNRNKIICGIFFGFCFILTSISHGENVALHKPAWATAELYGPALAAVDGIHGALWHGMNPWNSGVLGTATNPIVLFVDLQNIYLVDQINLYADNRSDPAAYISYKILSSTDNASWTTVSSGDIISIQNPWPKQLDFNTIPMRYLRYEVTGGTLWAHLYEMEVYGTPFTYALTTKVLNGEGSVAPSGDIFQVGTKVSLVASPPANYQVKVWHGTDDDSSTDITNEVTINADKTVEVEFEPKTYEIILTQTGIPSSPQPSIIPATFGTIKSLSVVPPQGYCVKYWHGTDDDSSRENTNQVIVDADKQVIVDYASIISPTKCLIESLRQAGLVYFSISGDFQSSSQQIAGADKIIFRIWSADNISYEEQIPFDITKLKNGKFVYKNTIKQIGQNVVESFILDFKNNTFVAVAKNVELTVGLKLPIYIDVEIGEYSGLGKVDENMDSWMIMMKDTK